MPAIGGNVDPDAKSYIQVEADLLQIAMMNFTRIGMSAYSGADDDSRSGGTMCLVVRYLLYVFTAIAPFLYVGPAIADDDFTIRVTWKCLSPSVIGNYPCRNSSETLTSFPGGVVYVYADGVYCDNASAQAPNAYKLALGKRSSGTLLCKTPAYEGVIKYNGTIKATKDGYAVELSGKFTVRWGAGMKQNRQSLSFAYGATFKAEGSRCFGTKSWRFNGQMNSVPGASGRYTYTASKCAIGK